MSDARFVIRSHRRPWGRRWTFVLLSVNNEAVLSSEPYNSYQAAADGILAVKRLAAEAPIVDMTA